MKNYHGGREGEGRERGRRTIDVKSYQLVMERRGRTVVMLSCAQWLVLVETMLAVYLPSLQ